jgi:hypothetical protein
LIPMKPCLGQQFAQVQPLLHGHGMRGGNRQSTIHGWVRTNLKG